MIHYIIVKIRKMWLGSESKRGDSLIRVIAHKNLSNKVDGELILVWSFRIHIVKRIGVGCDSIGACEINRDNHIKF